MQNYLVSSAPDAAEPRWKPAVTVTAIVERGGKFLIVKEQTPAGIKYNSPAGHLEPGESLIQACQREVLEETAFDFEPTGVIGIYLSRFIFEQQDKTFLRVAFRGKLTQEHLQRPLDTGIINKLWLTKEEIQARHNQLRTPMLMRNINDYLAGKNYSLELIYTHDTVYYP